ncbi:hypothetical protein BJ170DRAFT_678591 [Xylariales sp. AK1849]|nr:hypothetical protein BJ170DRAFT_678591 [Xylariales sp. AK1849]
MSSAKLGVAGQKRALAPPSPSPSNASNTSHGTPSKKQKKMKREAIDAATRIRDAATPTPAAAAASHVNYGSSMDTQLMYAVEFLKSKGATKTLQETLDHLTLQHAPEERHRLFAGAMRRHPAITFIADPKSKDKDAVPSWRKGRYEFKAKIPGVNSKTTLLARLQAQQEAKFLDVKDLKDGWPDCDKAIDELEAAHKLLVVRTKKDGHAKLVWIDQPELSHPVDPEFRVMWSKVKLPDPDDLVRKLVSVGQKPASDDSRAKIKITDGKDKKKKRVNRTSKRQTNEHMKGILQDYSHLKR